MTKGSVDQIYRDQVILDHCRNPRNQRIVKSPDITGDAVNPFCGDEIHIQILMVIKNLKKAGKTTLELKSLKYI